MGSISRDTKKCGNANEKLLPTWWLLSVGHGLCNGSNITVSGTNANSIAQRAEWLLVEIQGFASGLPWPPSGDSVPSLAQSFPRG